MKVKHIIILSTVGLLAIFALVVFNQYRATFDKNVELKNQFKAQKSVVDLNYDKMFKIIKQEAQVTDKAVESFKEIYIPLIEGRYSQGDGTLMKWITEQNPQFDQSLFKKLMQDIEALRDEFFQEQKKLVAIKEQHDNLRQRFWSRIFLGNEKELEYKPILSTQTEEVSRTGKEDNIDVFDKKDS